MSNRYGLRRNTMWLVLAILAMAAGLAACKPQEQDLSFETIAQGAGFPSGRSYGGKEPDFLVITRPEEVDTPGLDVQFTSELAKQLRDLDYEHTFAVMVFRGLLSAQNPKYTPELLQVTRSGNSVVLKAHFGQPGPNELVHPAFSSPYRVITVSKDRTWAQNIRFVLEVDGQEVSEHSHFIP